MTTTNPESASDLLDASIDVVLQNSMIIKFVITTVVDDDVDETGKKEPLVLMLLPTTSVSDLKRLLKDRLQIPEQEQHLVLSNDRPLLHGSICSHQGQQLLSGVVSRPSPETHIHVHRVEMEPRLESLFSMVGLSDWEERDEIMSRMVKARSAQNCNNGHKLIQLDPDKYKPTSRDESYLCKKCHIDFHGDMYRRDGNTYGRVTPFVCEQCNFCLCNFCISKDEGSTAADDPFQALQILALDIARKMANMGSYYGGKGHMCGHLPVSCNSEFAPQMFIQPRRGGFPMKPGQKILHSGIRLVIRFDDQSSTLVKNYGYELAMKELEIDEIRENGACIRDLMKLRKQWLYKEEKVIPAILFREAHNRFPTYSGQAYETTKCISYSLEEVVYEVGVSVSDGDY